MPNFKLNDGVKSDIRGVVNLILDRRVAYAQDAFPLTAAQVQHALMAEDALIMLWRLNDMDIRGLPRKTTASLVINDTTPGITRAVGVYVYTPEPIFCDVDWNFYGDEYEAKNITNPRLIFDPTKFDDTTVAAVAKWVNGVVREKRLQEMVRWLVDRMLKHHLPTTGHLLVRWPSLATLVKDPLWKGRLRNPPVRNRQYQWDKVLPPNDLAPLMKAAEAVLLGGDMLAPYESDKEVTRATVQQWQRLDTDRKF